MGAAAVSDRCQLLDGAPKVVERYARGFRDRYGEWPTVAQVAESLRWRQAEVADAARVSNGRLALTHVLRDKMPLGKYSVEVIE